MVSRISQLGTHISQDRLSERQFREIVGSYGRVAAMKRMRISSIFRGYSKDGTDEKFMWGRLVKRAKKMHTKLFTMFGSDLYLACWAGHRPEARTVLRTGITSGTEWLRKQPRIVEREHSTCHPPEIHCHTFVCESCFPEMSFWMSFSDVLFGRRYLFTMSF